MMDDKKECCATCAFCAKLYIPPCNFYADVRKTVGYTDRNIYVCNLFLAESNEVMWLGKDVESGMCEVWTDKEKLNDRDITYRDSGTKRTC